MQPKRIMKRINMGLSAKTDCCSKGHRPQILKNLATYLQSNKNKSSTNGIPIDTEIADDDTVHCSCGAFHHYPGPIFYGSPAASDEISERKPPDKRICSISVAGVSQSGLPSI
ncbi:hypothetical protein CDAR_285451 [Caerostris darwini]|uniref:Uncharacterized protein n=1 Tax=Caerostris darwini TaxID=1538125 RepID=A0AAV4RI43_9ARAC|nr:hypothetical protein CDAR_285451 [Caerostris darwini]